MDLKSFALNKSLDSLYESGMQILNEGDDQKIIHYLREYSILYSEIKEFLLKNMNGNSEISGLIAQLPDIQYREFKNYFYLTLEYIFDELYFGFRGSRAHLNEFFDVDVYPKRTRYINETRSKIRLIIQKMREVKITLRLN